MGTMPKPPSRKRTAQHNEPTFGVPRCTAQAPQRDLKPQMQFRVDQTAIRRPLAGCWPRARLCQWSPGNRTHNGNPTRSFGNLIETRTRSSIFHWPPISNHDAAGTSICWSHAGCPRHTWSMLDASQMHPGSILVAYWSHPEHPGRILGASWAQAWDIHDKADKLWSVHRPA